MFQEQVLYEVSRAQERIYTAQKMLPEGDTTYIFSRYIKTGKKLSRVRTIEALKKLICRHESLRTGFQLTGNGLFQTIYDADEIWLEEALELSELDDEAELYGLCLDLSRAPLFRWKLESDRISFHWHHIINDGMGAALFACEFVRLYNGEKLDSLSMHQKEYAARENQWIRSTEYKLQRTEWTKLLNGFENVRELRLPADGTYDKTCRRKAGHIFFHVSKDISERVNNLCTVSGVTPYIFFISVFSLMLFFYTGQSRFIIGTVMRNKEDSSLDSILGMFVNTVPLVISLKKDESLNGLLESLRNTVISARENQRIALEDIAHDFGSLGGVDRTLHDHLMFDVLFTKKEFYGQLPPLNNEPAELCFIDEEMPIYDLSIQMGKENGCYDFELVYDTGLFDEACMTEMSKHYVNLISSCIESPDAIVSDLSMLDGEEKLWLLEHGKSAGVTHNENTVIGRIGRRAESSPAYQAIIFNEKTITYGEMWSASARLADMLLNAYEDKPAQGGERRTILISERGIEMIVSILGILRSGAGYVPVSPDYPDDRILYIIRDSRPDAVLISDVKLSEGIMNALEQMNLPVFYTDKQILYGNAAGEYRTEAETVSPERLPAIKPEQIAYMIYTSGTTGEPKGVVVEHRQLSALLDAYEDIYDLNDDDTVLQFASYVFDQSVWEIFHILTKGGTLCLASEEHTKDPDKLMDYCEDNLVTVIMMTPGYLKLLDAERLPSLRLVDVGGEAPSRSLLKTWSVNGRTVINTYGPTETTVNASSYIYADKGTINEKTGISTENVPIGKPAPGMEMYIMNGDSLSGTGVPGELCIGGPQVARGYHDREELTLRKFVVNPFGKGRLYRSGDLARVLPDGNIEFINRIDDQIKIRGFRVELGEIESVMKSLDMIDEAIVVLRKDDNDDKLLCGYYTVADKDGAADRDIVRKALEERLPMYMIPSVLIQVKEFKLTINGKIDRRDLPYSSSEAVRNGRDEEPASVSTKEENDCIEAFRKVLGIKDIRVTDDFLAIGGDSIKAIRIVSLLRDMGYATDAPTLLRSRTIRSLASRIEREEIKSYSEYTKVIPTPVMRIFTGSHFANPAYYNQSSVLVVKGRTSVRALERSLNTLVCCHGMLRMISDEKGNIRIRDKESVRPLKLDVYNIPDEHGREEIMNRLHSSMDPVKGIVMRAALFMDGKKDRLFLAFHHYVIDEVSWGIIISDLNILYSHALGAPGKESCTSCKEYEDDLRILPAPSVSFGEWSGRLWGLKELAVFGKEKEYWTKLHERFSEAWEGMNKRLAGMRIPSVKSSGCLSVSACADKSVADVIFEVAHNRYGARVDTVLIAALVRAASAGDDKTPVVIQLESHGRGNIGEGIVCDRTVGWFTAVYPIVIRCLKNVDEQIIEIKELLAAVPNSGIGYGILFDDLADKGGLVFNYLGSSESESDELISRSDEYSGANMDSRNIEPGTVSFNLRATEQGINIECVYDDIYDTDSISALVSRFREELVFITKCIEEDNRVYTPSDLCINRLLSDKEWNCLTTAYPPESIEAIAELTPLQKGMLFRYLSDPKSGAYLLQDRLTIRNTWSRELFETALNALFVRFDALRIRFMYKGLTEPVQVILREGSIKPLFTEVSGKSFTEIAREDLERGIDPADDIMMRVTFNKDSCACEEKELLITTHHCIIDGWSFPILTDTLMSYYNMLLKGISADDLMRMAKKESLRGCSYADFLREGSTRGSDEKLEKWGRYLGDFDEGIGIDGTGCAPKSGSGAEYEMLYVDKNTENLIRIYTEKYRITAGCFFGCVWGLLLGFENNVEDVVFGETVSGRDRSIDGLVNAVGMFINTIPVRIKWSNDEYVSDIFRQRQEDYYAMQPVTDCPLDKIMADGAQASGLIHTLYVYENYPNSGMQDNNHTVTLMHEEVDYPMSISVGEGEGFAVTFQYDGAKYDRRYVKLLIRRYEHIVTRIVSDGDIKISDIDRLSEDERENMLAKICGVNAPITKDTVLDLIGRHVDRSPDRTAVVMGENSLSYAGLWKESCELASVIGYGEERFIAVYADRGPKMIVAMLASMLAGAAYVPVDPLYPDERIGYILKDCNADMVLKSIDPGTDDRSSLFRELGATVIDVSDEVYDGADISKIMSHGFDRLRNRLAYMIYTSGTTGNPKGVEIEHAALAQMISSNIKRFGLFDGVVLMPANFVFDASVWDLFITLASGGTVCIIPRDILLNSKLTAMYCRKHGVDMMGATNALLQALDPADFGRFRLVCAGGDAANAEIFAAWSECTDMMVNDYGPTEACVNATSHVYIKDEGNPIPIGRPYHNKKIYVMQGDKLCGIGQKGEICIGGNGLARGYHNLPEISRKVFRPNQFGEGRIYRTGDLGLFGLDGELRFLGRNDDQIKIRGYRIETGEIESCIRKFRDIKDAAVIGRKKGTGEVYLAAYVVWKTAPAEEALKSWLLKKLPSYMVPAAIVSMERLPLTINGKLNRKELPEPVRTVEYRTPEGYFEQLVAELFEQILGIERVGRDDSFFELGGSSIDMMKLVAGLSGYAVGIADIVSAPTPALLGEHLLNGWNGLERRGEGMLMLRDGNPDEASIFCIPPSGGMSLCYLPLINELGYKGRIYGLTDEKYARFSKMTIEELEGYNLYSGNSWERTIERYMGNITGLFKDGDIIMGYSQGGTAAQIIAGRLEDQGSKAGRIIMLEAVPPGSEDIADTGYTGRAERLITSVALFLGKDVQDKYRAVSDDVSDTEYLRNCLRNSLGEEASETMLHSLYETYLVYSSNILNPLEAGKKTGTAIDCIILGGEASDEEMGYSAMRLNPWKDYSMEEGKAFEVKGSLDEHFVFLSKYRRFIKDIVKELLKK